MMSENNREEIVVHQRTVFWEYHLTAAVDNLKTIKKIEEFVPEKNIGDEHEGMSIGRWKTKHDSLVISTLISSYSTLESAINSFIDAVCNPIVRNVPRKGFGLQRLQKEQIIQFEEVYPGDIYEDIKPLDKFNVIIELCDSECFDKGVEPYQSMNIIRKMRNHFVHHKPDIIEINDEKPQTKLGSTLMSKGIEPKPEGWEKGDRPYFPYQCLSSDLTSWSISTTINFINEFFDRIGGETILKDKTIVKEFEEIEAD
jgi:hypothetical protein